MPRSTTPGRLLGAFEVENRRAPTQPASLCRSMRLGKPRSSRLVDVSTLGWLPVMVRLTGLLAPAELVATTACGPIALGAGGVKRSAVLVSGVKATLRPPTVSTDTESRPVPVTVIGTGWYDVVALGVSP